MEDPPLHAGNETSWLDALGIEAYGTMHNAMMSSDNPDAWQLTTGRFTPDEMAQRRQSDNAFLKMKQCLTICQNYRHAKENGGNSTILAPQ